MGQKTPQKQQVKSLWCPNCGIPRNSLVTLKTLLRKRKSLQFVCPGCKLVVEIGVPQKKKKKDEEPPFKMKDLTNAVKIVKMFGGR